MWPWASRKLSRSPPASFATGRYQSLICLPHRAMVGIKLKDAYGSVLTSLIWTPAVFICSTFTEYLLLVWYSEEITGLETLHLNSDFNIYWLCSSSGSIFRLSEQSKACSSVIWRWSFPLYLRIKWANVCESDKVLSNYELENICIPLTFISNRHHDLHMTLLTRMGCLWGTRRWASVLGTFS